LTASDGQADGGLGAGLAVSGNTVVVGAPGDNGSYGAVYVFVKPPGGWANMTQTAKLTPSDGTFESGFGNIVAIDGNTVVVGAFFQSGPGAVYVFVEPQSGWTDMTETAELTASDGSGGAQLGISVGVSGDTILAGAFVANKAYVWVRPATGWVNATQTAELTASDQSALLGYSAGISGNAAVVGAPLTINSGSKYMTGAGYVFVKPPGGWTNMTQTAKLTSSPSLSNEFFGGSTSISGNTIVLGAPTEGTAFVFVKPATGWADMTQTARLDNSGMKYPGCSFGNRVAISGSVIVAGAIGTCGAREQGAAYMFVEPPGGWKTPTDPKAKLTDGVASDDFGSSVGTSENTVFVGAPETTIGSNASQGAAYVFGP
jgi:hypothetical protein